jgi:hypothetical protein
VEEARGLTVIAPDKVEPFLRQLPVDALWGVGPATARKLRARGIHQLVDVRRTDEQVLREAVGSMAEWLRQLASGIDPRAVEPHREAKSSGSENTYAEDLTNLETIRQEILDMAGHAVDWLFRRHLLARTVTIKVRYSDFTTITRSHTAEPSRDRAELSARAVGLLDKTAAGARPIRLLGVSVHNLCAEDEQRLRPGTGCRFLRHSSGPVLAIESRGTGGPMLLRKRPLENGTDTEIDLIEREMEGGVIVEQPLEIHEHSVEERFGGLVQVEEDIDVRKLEP